MVKESDQNRIIRRKETDEYFTDPKWVKEYIKFYNFKDTEDTVFIDPTAGDSRWIEPLQNKNNSVWAVDIVKENCIESINNLYGEGEVAVCPSQLIPEEYSSQDGFINLFMHNNKLILNVVQADATKFSLQRIYNFYQNKARDFGNGLFEIED